LYGIFRYQLLSDPKDGSDLEQLGNGEQVTERPDEVLLSDRPILGAVIGWIMTSVVILYLESRGII
jgi:hypothetical protein